jgi:GTPase SAR1 family protein
VYVKISNIVNSCGLGADFPDVFSTVRCTPVSPHFPNLSHTKLRPRGADGLVPMIVRFALHDTNGTERFRHIPSGLYRSTSAFLICFNVLDSESFENAWNWLRETEIYGPPNAVKILVGCQVDRAGSRAVSVDDIEKLRVEQDLEYAEVSSQTGAGVEELFCRVVQSVVTVHSNPHATKGKRSKRRRKDNCSVM